jgi:hypothetical protein
MECFKFLVFWLMRFVKQFAPVASLGSYWGLVLSLTTQNGLHDGNDL